MSNFPYKFQQKNHPVVWIVGGADFLGLHLTKLLLDKRITIVIFDANKSATQHKFSRLRQSEADIIFEQGLTSHPVHHLPKPDYVFNCETVSTHGLMTQNVREYLVGVQNSLEFALHAKARFLLVSLNVDDYKQNHGVRTFDDVIKQENPVSEAARFAEGLTAQYSRDNHLDARIVRVPDVYGPDMPIIAGDSLVAILNTVFHEQSVCVEESTVQPLYVEDAARGMLSAMFGIGTRGVVFSFPAETFRLSDIISTAETIIDGKQVWFFGLGNFVNLQSHEYALPITTTLPEGIRKMFEYFALPNTDKELKKDLNFLKQPHKLRISFNVPHFSSRGWVLGGIAFCASLCIPFINFFLALGLIWGGIRFLETGNTIYSQKAFSLARGPLLVSKFTFSKLNSLPITSKLFKPFYDTSEAGILGLQVGLEAIKFYDYGQNILLQLFFQQDKENFFSADDFITLGVHAKSFAQALGFLRTQLPQKSFFVNLPSQDKLSRSQKILDYTASLLQHSADLFGFEEPRTYLILVQNNFQPRPTGGVIYAFGFMRFENGVITDAVIESVDVADKSLGGVVEPPGELRAGLGTKNWYLRDSNWSPDFPTSALRAEWFVDKALAQKVDGVVAFDLEFLHRLLSATGEVEIQNFNTTASSDSFSKVVKNQFRNRDFVVSLTRSMIESLQTKGPRSTVGLGKTLVSSLEERHMVIYLHDAPSRAAIHSLGWDGSMRNANCSVSVETCLKDYLMVIDAVGLDVENSQVARNFTLDTFVSKNQIVHDLAATYTNKGGIFQSYTRVYVPEGAKLLKSEIVDTVKNERSLVAGDTFTEKGRLVYGVPILIPEGGTRQLFISWQIPISQGVSTVSFLWQKQAGVDEHSVTTRFYPSDMPLRVRADEGTERLTRKAPIGYTSTLQKDFEVFLVWTDQN